MYSVDVYPDHFFLSSSNPGHFLATYYLINSLCTWSVQLLTIKKDFLRNLKKPTLNSKHLAEEYLDLRAWIYK